MEKKFEYGSNSRGLCFEICSSPPDSISTPKEDAAYHKWQKADKLARCYILALMSNVLQQLHERMLTAYDILLNVKEMFGEQGRAARQVAMKALLNIKMAEGSPVQEHVLKMIFYLNELEVLGAEVDGETQIDIVLM